MPKSKIKSRVALNFITLKEDKQELNALTQTEAGCGSYSCINCSNVQHFYRGVIDPPISAFSAFV